jgi:thiamine-monophosphate kinase
MQLSKIGEFGIINRLRRRFINTSPEILKGIGDDAAAIKDRGKINLLTTDMLLEGIHFDLSFTTFFQLGYKSLAVNISDIFAMGGTPKYFLVSLGLPKDYTLKEVDEFYSGLLKIAKKSGVRIIGGDISASKKGLIICGALTGEAKRVIMRSGAREGDGIFLTGTLGDSAMGLLLLKKIGKRIPLEAKGLRSTIQSEWFSLKDKGLSLKKVLPLIKRHILPDPVPLRDTKKVSSMIDISDGLLIDLSHICEESKVGATIYADKIPLSEELKYTARNLGIDPLRFALRGGEDYVLLFTAAQDMRTDAIRIGEITKKGRFIINSKGTKISFGQEGYEHFRSSKFKV